ncbi:D-alanine--D-serine ligase VanG [Ruminiclostridium papyrosolvens]|uniref:D-alanine--D-alanine ligase n=1 Tax=Ruminiclostridium papyrosolvens C7 TaxID=1330534 RepID=U4R4D7_9FIRM|nr:D-alanine--D-serine ligase VanG [Ruminiclostridium papyrosolvens]EPR13374.1 D-alanine--D-alanine ligase [Ruminiclostridium papyrosolvens C7]
MDRKNIAIIFGGCSPEYEVSLNSASAVIEHVNNDLYNTILIGITKEGEWLRYFGEADKIRNNTWFEEGCNPVAFSQSRSIHGFYEFSEGSSSITFVDAAFPVLHGKNGEDGTVQGMLKLAGIPFVGCGILSSAMCMDKDIAHRIAQSSGVRVPISISADRTMLLQDIFNMAETLRYPVFVKPARAGSSFGITRANSRPELEKAILYAFEYDSKIVVEENIDGFEIGCAILGSDNLILGEVDEIELQTGFFDYNEKYTLNTSKIHMPARIDKVTSDRIKNTARILYNALCCTGFARVDMFLTPKGEIVFNEVNTIPGFTAHSRYPNMLRGVGLSFASIVDRLIRMAMEK